MFPSVIPLSGTDCSRVTHPSAARTQGRSPVSPLDLHVLGTPPAFVLSQDQTLMFNPSRSLAPASGSPKPSALALLRCLLSQNLTVLPVFLLCIVFKVRSRPLPSLARFRNLSLPSSTLAPFRRHVLVYQITPALSSPNFAFYEFFSFPDESGRAPSSTGCICRPASASRAAAGRSSMEATSDCGLLRQSSWP